MLLDAAAASVTHPQYMISSAMLHAWVPLCLADARPLGRAPPSQLCIVVASATALTPLLLTNAASWELGGLLRSTQPDRGWVLGFFTVILVLAHSLVVVDGSAVVTW